MLDIDGTIRDDLIRVNSAFADFIYEIEQEHPGTCFFVTGRSPNEARDLLILGNGKKLLDVISAVNGIFDYGKVLHVNGEVVDEEKLTETQIEDLLSSRDLSYAKLEVFLKKHKIEFITDAERSWIKIGKTFEEQYVFKGRYDRNNLASFGVHFRPFDIYPDTVRQELMALIAEFEKTLPASMMRLNSSSPLAEFSPRCYDKAKRTQYFLSHHAEGIEFIITAGDSLHPRGADEAFMRTVKVSDIKSLAVHVCPPRVSKADFATLV